MKKIMAGLLLSIVLVLSGCGDDEDSTPSSCNFTGLPPGATFQIFYTRPVLPTEIILTRVVPASGTITVPAYDYPCSSLMLRVVTNSNLALSASPSSVNLLAPPSTATITGQSFNTTYGMPMVEYFDSNGYMVGSVYATSVSSDGTSLQASMPDLSYVHSGTYQVRVTNCTYEGYYLNIVGSATMTGWGRNRPDIDGDGWYDDEDCDPYDPYRNYNCSCGGNDGGFQQPIFELCPAY